MIKKFAYVISFCLLTQVSFTASDSSSGSDSDSYSNPHNAAKNFVKKGKKLYEVPINYNGRSHEDGKKIKFYHIFPVIYQIIAGRIF